MRSVMQHLFSQVPKADIPRSQFNRSHGHKTTFDAGYLVPLMIDEALPGDTMNCRLQALLRTQPSKFPFMDNLFFDVHFFAVPIRLLWNNWQKFNGEQIDPGDSTDYTIPQMVSPVGGYTIGSLSDYFGIRTGIAGVSHSSLFHRAYNLIYNEWYRDQNLQDSVVVDKDDGPDSPTDYVLLKRGKRHDYFTSCLPWPQKGPAVTLPIGSSAPIALADESNPGNIIAVNASTGAAMNGSYDVTIKAGGLLNVDSVGAEINIDPNDTWVADLSNATASTINALRQAFQIQKLLERDARGGTRYTEIVRAHFGVVSPDARMQRPELLGMGSSVIRMHPIAQTSETGTTPKASLSAFGVGNVNGIGFTKSFTEHCIIMALGSVRADLTYQQGLNRMFSRLERYDFYWPALSHLGEQAVLNKEIFLQGTAADDQVFGYQERYAEYRYKPSQITGKYRSDAAGSLDVWHLSQDFAALPVLNDEFIEEDPPIDRVIAITDEPQFLLDCYFDYKCARPMPLYSVPGLIDHF